MRKEHFQSVRVKRDKFKAEQSRADDLQDFAELTVMKSQIGSQNDRYIQQSHAISIASDWLCVATYLMFVPATIILFPIVGHLIHARYSQ